MSKTKELGNTFDKALKVIGEAMENGSAEVVARNRERAVTALEVVRIYLDETRVAPKVPKTPKTPPVAPTA